MSDSISGGGHHVAVSGVRDHVVMSPYEGIATFVTSS